MFELDNLTQPRKLCTCLICVYVCGRYTKNGQLAIAGFSDPHRDAMSEDLKLWLPEVPPQELDFDMSKFLLSQVGDHFCDLLEQEKEAIQIHMSDGTLTLCVPGISGQN